MKDPEQIADELLQSHWGIGWKRGVPSAVPLYHRIVTAIQEAVEEAEQEAEKHVMGRLELPTTPMPGRCGECQWYSLAADNVPGMGVCVLHNGRRKAETRRMTFKGLLLVDEQFGCCDWEKGYA